MNEVPSAKRFRFRRRTWLIVVTIAVLGCGYVAWEFGTSRLRNEARAWVKAGGGSSYSYHDSYRLNVLGDWRTEVFHLPESKFTAEDAARIKSLFPEANVYRDSRPVIWSDDNSSL